MVGATLSSTTMLCVQVLELPQSSVAIQTRMMVNSCGQAPAIPVSENVSVTVPSQLSVAVAIPFAPPGAVLAVHAIVTFGGHEVITGATLSSTTMVCVHETEFPQSSLATQVLVMVYSCGHPPAAVTSEDVIVGVPSHASVAVAVPFVPPGAVLAAH